MSMERPRGKKAKGDTLETMRRKGAERPLTPETPERQAALRAARAALLRKEEAEKSRAERAKPAIGRHTWHSPEPASEPEAVLPSVDPVDPTFTGPERADHLSYVELASVGEAHKDFIRLNTENKLPPAVLAREVGRTLNDRERGMFYRDIARAGLVAPEDVGLPRPGIHLARTRRAEGPDHDRLLSQKELAAREDEYAFGPVETTADTAVWSKRQRLKYEAANKKQGIGELGVIGRTREHGHERVAPIELATLGKTLESVKAQLGEPAGEERGVPFWPHGDDSVVVFDAIRGPKSDKLPILVAAYGTHRFSGKGKSEGLRWNPKDKKFERADVLSAVEIQRRRDEGRAVPEAGRINEAQRRALREAIDAALGGKTLHPDGSVVETARKNGSEPGVTSMGPEWELDTSGV